MKLKTLALIFAMSVFSSSNAATASRSGGIDLWGDAVQKRLSYVQKGLNKHLRDNNNSKNSDF